MPKTQVKAILLNRPLSCNSYSEADPHKSICIGPRQSCIENLVNRLAKTLPDFKDQLDYLMPALIHYSLRRTDSA